MANDEAATAIEYTLIGVITEVRDLNNTNDSPS